MISIGVRAHDFGRLPADELAARISAKGLTCVQLALAKAIADFEFRSGGLDRGLAIRIRDAFSRHGLQVAVLGCYINPIHPDLPTRAAALGWFKEHLAFARALGCGVVALESGSVNADYSPSTNNHGEAAFQEMLRSIAELVATAEGLGVTVGLEGVTSHPVSTPRKMKRVLDSIGSNHLAVVFDPVNFLSSQNCGEQRQLVEESLELWGERIVAVHAKDYLARPDGLKVVPVGRGEMDYGPILRGLVVRKRRLCVLLEDVTEGSVQDAADALRWTALALSRPSSQQSWAPGQLGPCPATASASGEPRDASPHRAPTPRRSA